MAWIGAPAYRRRMTKHRILLLAWIGLMVGFALMPLQWHDRNWPYYSAFAALAASASGVRAVLRWNKPNA